MRLNSVLALAKCSSYNDEVKNSYRLAVRQWLKRLAIALQLNSENYEIRFNAGGIAVSGDGILHHESFYIHVSDSGCYWRTCKGQKDYTGGTNQWVTRFGVPITEEELVVRINQHLQKI